MGFLDIFKTKKVTEFTREDLQKFATENKIDFEADITDENLQKLVSDFIANNKPPQPPTDKKIKIRFILSPTGRFNLGYHIGNVVKFEENKATELIEAGYAEKV